MKSREIVIISGKGGSGKTSLAAAYARQARDRAVFADTDVDAADLSILMESETIRETRFLGPREPVIDHEKCINCGKCYQLCRFEAISEQIEVDSLKCEGCGVCATFCPTEAIEMVLSEAGSWYVSETPYGPLVHARLDPGAENSGKLVAVVRQGAEKLAKELRKELIISDGPPGIGCPAISALTGADLAVIVAEATESGIHDALRALDLVNFLDISCLFIINKYDLNLAATAKLENVLRQRSTELIGKLPYDEIFYQALVEGKSIIDLKGVNPYIKDSVEKSWEKIMKKIKNLNKEEKQ